MLELVRSLPLFWKQRDKILGKTVETETPSEESSANYVITISREFGSGGREIGKLLAKQLGFHYYDSELINLTAEKSGYTPEYVEENEQALKNPMTLVQLRLHRLLHNCSKRR